MPIARRVDTDDLNSSLARRLEMETPPPDVLMTAARRRRQAILLTAKLFFAVVLFLAPQGLFVAVRTDDDCLLVVARARDVQSPADAVAVLDAPAHAGVDQEQQAIALEEVLLL